MPSTASLDSWTTESSNTTERPEKTKRKRNGGAEPTESTRKSARLQVVLCHYDSGKLEKTIKPINNTSYLAISHVWGEVDWQEVPGIEGEILVSKEKAKFMTERLNAVVGTDYFWMDILCVDQRDKAARIAVTQHIPTIFRRAQRTIVVRDGTGFRSCCVEAMGIPKRTPKNWLSDNDCRYHKKLARHYKSVHNEEVFADGVLTRLWPLQEVMLSDTIQFVQCDFIEVKRYTDISPHLNISGALHPLQMMSVAWKFYGHAKIVSANRDGLDLDFLRAFFTCGTAARAARHPPQFPSVGTLWLERTSTRRTSKPRDFILAIMPQYAFYTLPKNAKAMSFAELFVDCFVQLQSKCRSLQLAPLLGILDSVHNMPSPTNNIPSALFLGDVVKLFYGPMLTIGDHFGGLLPLGQKKIMSYRVQVEDTSNLTRSDTLQCIRRSIQRSRTTWNFAERGELKEYRDWDFLQLSSGIEDATIGIRSEIHHAGSVLSLVAADYRIFAEILDNEIDVTGSDMFTRMAGLISCGLGISAFEWSEDNLTPVLVTFGGKKILALVPKSVLSSDRGYGFYLIRVARQELTDTRRFALVAWNQKVDSESHILCLFPPEIDL